MSRWRLHDPRVVMLLGYPVRLVLDVDGERVDIPDALEMWPEDLAPRVNMDRVVARLRARAEMSQ